MAPKKTSTGRTASKKEKSTNQNKPSSPSRTRQSNRREESEPPRRYSNANRYNDYDEPRNVRSSGRIERSEPSRFDEQERGYSWDERSSAFDNDVPPRDPAGRYDSAARDDDDYRERSRSSHRSRPYDSYGQERGYDDRFDRRGYELDRPSEDDRYFNRGELEQKDEPRRFLSREQDYRDEMRNVRHSGRREDIGAREARNNARPSQKEYHFSKNESSRARTSRHSDRY